MSSPVIGAMDAATVYGASRWLRNEYWESGRYSRADDQESFNDFIHDLVLYDHIIVYYSRTCQTIELTNEINERCGFELIEEQEALDEYSSQTAAMHAVARLLAGIVDQGELHRFNPRVPYLYQAGRHVDSVAMMEVARMQGLEPTLVPLALFLYRGLCYAGLANAMAKRERVAVAYVASPGRISAMQLVMSKKDVATTRYPRIAYQDLVAQLQLPSTGYDFGFLDSFPASALSGLALAVSNELPSDALKSVLAWRSSEKADRLRDEWSDRILGYRDSVAIGTGLTQNIVNSHITGDVQQIIRGLP